MYIPHERVFVSDLLTRPGPSWNLAFYISRECDRCGKCVFSLVFGSNKGCNVPEGDVRAGQLGSRGSAQNFCRELICYNGTCGRSALASRKIAGRPLLQGLHIALQQPMWLESQAGLAPSLKAFRIQIILETEATWHTQGLRHGIGKDKLHNCVLHYRSLSDAASTSRCTAPIICWM